MRKVVFLRVAQCSQLEDTTRHTTVLVLSKSADGYLSIQGHSPVAWSERHLCWQLFRRAAKSLLGVCESSVVSVRLSEPPHTAVKDLADVFREPSHIVSLTLSVLPADEEADQEDQRSRATATADARGAWQQQHPRPLSSGLYEAPRRHPSPSSPLSSPRAQRRRLDGREMEKLLAQLDEVSQSLERTQSRCEAIARRCGAREDTDCAPRREEDARVERLLQTAERLTSQIISQQQKQQRRHGSRSPTPGVTSLRQQQARGVGLPEPPREVCVQPSVNGGALIFWSPLRLDERDRSNGYKVAGYAVYVDGVMRSEVNEPFASHTEIEGLENGVQYKIQVSSLTDHERKESSLTAPILYRHECHVHSSFTHPPTGHQNQSAKVEDWLLRSSELTPSSSTAAQSPSKTPLVVNKERSEFTGRIGSKSSSGDKLLTAPSDSTHLPEDVWSMGSSHTSGIVMDHPPGSLKFTPSCPSYCHGDGFSVNSGATTIIVDGQLSSLPPHHPHHQLHFTPSPSPTPSPTVTPSRGQSPAYREGLREEDTVIDEPLDLSTFPSEVEEGGRERGRAASTVQLVAGSMHKGPAPPTNIQVRYRESGHVTVSWNPTRRDAKGCSNGCFVLGYRVYINGTSRVSVDGPMSHETTMRWPHVDSNHKITVHVRTRSIASESSPSSTILYDLLLHKSVEQYSPAGLKVSSALSSTATLCPSNRLHPLHKPCTPRKHTTIIGQETFV